MKKKNTILYLIIIGALLVGAILGIVVNLLMGNTLEEMFASKFALTIYISIAAFLVIFVALILYDWGRK